MKVEQDNVAQMSISHTTNVKNLAASIAKQIQRGRVVRMTAIGAGAINQMTKASACSLQYLAPVGIDVRWKIFFTDRPIPEDIKLEIAQRAAEAAILEDPANPPRAPLNERDSWSALVMESHILR